MAVRFLFFFFFFFYYFFAASRDIWVFSALGVLDFDIHGSDVLLFFFFFTVSFSISRLGFQRSVVLMTALEIRNLVFCVCRQIEASCAITDSVSLLNEDTE